MQRLQDSWSSQQQLAAESSAQLLARLTRHPAATGASSRHTLCGRYVDFGACMCVGMPVCMVQVHVHVGLRVAMHVHACVCGSSPTLGSAGMGCSKVMCVGRAHLRLCSFGIVLVEHCVVDSDVDANAPAIYVLHGCLVGILQLRKPAACSIGVPVLCTLVFQTSHPCSCYRHRDALILAANMC